MTMPLEGSYSAGSVLIGDDTFSAVVGEVHSKEVVFSFPPAFVYCFSVVVHVESPRIELYAASCVDKRYYCYQVVWDVVNLKCLAGFWRKF